MSNIARGALLICGLAWTAVSSIIAAQLIQQTSYEMQDAAEQRRKEKYARLE